VTTARPDPFTTWRAHVPFGDAALDVDVWSSASGRGVTSQDAWLVAPMPGRVRLAALDGITPTAATPSVGGLDGAAWAARVAAATLEAPVPAHEALARANAFLLEHHGVGLLRDRPHTMAAVADVVTVGGGASLEVTVAGDCQVFVDDGDGWLELCGGPLLTDEARRRWRVWHDANPGAHPVEGVAGAYERLLADPAVWRTTPVGLFDDLALARAHRDPGSWRQVVVASDGARLTDASVGRLSEWLAGLRRNEAVEHAGAFKPHDDVVVVVSGRLAPG